MKCEIILVIDNLLLLIDGGTQGALDQAAGVKFS
jgi:hypothetical protein